MGCGTSSKILALSESDRAQAAEVLVGAALEEGSCGIILAIVVVSAMWYSGLGQFEQSVSVPYISLLV
ncbi:hypothetical protein H257_12667 [Aphanomyces astaci]|uniref:Uncharacterized protein n=1 Tax=Aphanomyces astaci TaxID=112090 RepID=W4FYX9_APHAT|nr:hypothetical protein H257_12667 [Aphanomyces astaci]ETV72191.1 hypothetical protein H257_12667 [Aphanomyces astaci]|eukprot:XP_009838259.1 hypothetical protein H257_12667 [Aphanomyces astaci]